MANLQEAFQYAAQNPTSDFANNLKQLASSGSLDMEAKKYGIDLSPFKPEPTAMDQAKDVVTGVAKGAGRTVLGVAQGLQDIGQTVMHPSILTGNGVIPPDQNIKSLDTSTPEGQVVNQSLQPTNDAQKTGGQIETAGEILAGGGAGLIKDAVTGGAKLVGKGITELTPKLETILPKNLAIKAIDLVSADPEAKVATILKESKPEDLTNYVNIAQKASQDPRIATPLEVVGNKLADTTKVLETKLGEIGKAKSDIIQPMRQGLDSFKSETRPLIEKLNSLKNSFGEIEKGSATKVDAIIKDAKSVSTKLDADKFIDKVQNALYSGNRDMTIVQGSSLDKQLRGIIGEYNSTLKNSLPKEYGALNKQYSDMIDTLNVINRSLGEVVEGVPTRGASLIKQFFSPSGTKAKEIFDFVKQQTNGEVDLAKDATLAKFTMELFDDPRARSLLQGIGDIPTTVGGIVTKVADKIGGEKLQSAMRNSTIRKAIKTTLPK